MSNLTTQEHIARAMLLGMVYDTYTFSYRFKSPGGGKLKYEGALNAITMEPFSRGALRDREVQYNIGNEVSARRLGYK